MAASVSPARVGGVFVVRRRRGGRGPIAVMLLAFLDERVVRALQIRLLLHEFEDPSLVRQRRGFGFVRHSLLGSCVIATRGAALASLCDGAV